MPGTIAPHTNTVEVKLLPPLDKYSPKNGKVTVHQGGTIHALIGRLWLDPQLVKLASLDGRFASFDTPLKNVHHVLLMPSIGGG